MTASVQKRNLDLSIGYASLALFGVSIVVLIWFLAALVDSPEPLVSFVRREFERATEGRGDARATLDVLLMLSWGFLHSLMTRSRFKIHLQKLLRPHLEPAVYSIVASAGLIAICLLYRPIPREVYVLEGGAALLVQLLFYSAWALFFYCFFHLDALEIVGLRPILRYVDGVGKPLEPFRPTGPFLWVRHPVELSFLVAFWAAPSMTTGHLLFATVMTFYTFLGVDHEDRRMLDLHGPGYAEYIKRVPQILPLPR
jgi:protein-S-isoprenylcysteine O-methyltransferase Ste14